MNIKDGFSDEPEDVEETLRDFLEREVEKARMESPGQYWPVF